MKHIARILRKLADLVDPLVRPSVESDFSMNVQLACDTAKAVSELDKVRSTLENLIALRERLG